MGSASDDLIAKTRYLVFDSLFYGEPVPLFKKRFAVFCSKRLKNKLSSSNENSQSSIWACIINGEEKFTLKYSKYGCMLILEFSHWNRCGICHVHVTCNLV